MRVSACGFIDVVKAWKEPGPRTQLTSLNDTCNNIRANYQRD